MNFYFSKWRYHELLLRRAASKIGFQQLQALAAHVRQAGASKGEPVGCFRADTPGPAHSRTNKGKSPPGGAPRIRCRGDTPRWPPGVAGAPPAYGVGGTPPVAPRGVGNACRWVSIARASPPAEGTGNAIVWYAKSCKGVLGFEECIAHAGRGQYGPAGGAECS